MPQSGVATVRPASRCVPATSPSRPRSRCGWSPASGSSPYGLVHLVVAALIAQVALGDRERADKKGALQEIAETGVGPGAAVGGRGGWPRWSCCGSSTRCPRPASGRVAAGRADGGGRVGEAVATRCWPGRPRRSPRPRAATRSASRWSRRCSACPADGSWWGSSGWRSSRRAGTRSCTAYAAPSCANWPCRPASARLVVVLGTVGWTALGRRGCDGRGAAGRARPSGSTRAAPVGLDAGIRALAHQPFGPVLLLLLAAGLAVFAVYCLFDARYRAE